MYILANSGVDALTANLAACIYPSQFVVGIDILLIPMYDLFCVKHYFKFQVSSFKFSSAKHEGLNMKYILRVKCLCILPIIIYECGILPKFCRIITIPWQYPEKVYNM